MAQDAAVPPLAAPAEPPTPRAGVLNLRTGDVAIADRPNLLHAGAGLAGALRHVITLDGPMTPQRRQALADAGVRLYDYLPANSYIADLRQADAAALARLGFVTWVGEYDRAWKVDPQVNAPRAFQTVERQLIDAQGEVAVDIHLFAGEPAQPAIDAIGAIPGAVVWNTDVLAESQVITATLPREAVGALAGIESVQLVEPTPEITPRNDSVRWIIQSNVLNSTPLYDHGLHGEGQILGHMDGRIYRFHCSFTDPEGDPPGPNHRKILAYNQSEGSDSHGTHTAGSAVGDGGSATGNTRGVAYMARLVHNSWPSFSESGMTQRLNLHHSQGARVHTNSWGNDNTTSYDGLCRAIDNYSWTNDEGLVLFAVTNLSVLRNPENAKNCLAVGGSNDANGQHLHCTGGRGPTSDGRRKPEIYAPGCGIQSSRYSTSCSTMSMSGTSMATPAVAGMALLVRQYFTDGYYPMGAPNSADGFTPTGALIKAVLLNSAVDMTGVAGYPSDLEGWGRVLADNALYLDGDQRRLLVHDQSNNAPGALSTGESFELPFALDGSAEQLRVTLVWHDAPASVGASFAAVNNLDLVVVAPDGTEYLGNVFSGGQSTTGGSADIRNNVEQVHVSSPQTGAWTARVIGTAVNTGTQGFALVVTGQVAQETGCAADFDGDGKLTPADFSAFRAAFLAGDASADFDGDTNLTPADFSAFRAAFLAGCG